MRLAAAACGLAIVVVLAVFGVVLAQKVSTPPAAAVAGPPPAPTASEKRMAAAEVPPAGPASPPSRAAAVPAAPVPAPVSAAQSPFPPIAINASCPGNPNALGVSRVVEIDTTGGPGFGFEHFKSHDFLQEGEVVLTFDDGPWPRNTPAVLSALAAHCTKAIFFPIGEHSMWEPMILKQVAAAGHVVGSHTWSHQMLDKTRGRFRLTGGKSEVRDYDPKDEIEKGISAVRWAVGGPTAPFFRFPGLKHPPELVTYLGQRNFGIFSTDLDSFDFRHKKPEQVRTTVMTKLKKQGKGIVLMHDFQHSTAEAMAGLLNDLKAGGYKVVIMKPKFVATTLPAYDEAVIKEMKLPTSDGRPTASVVRTVNE